MCYLISIKAAIDALGERPVTWIGSEYEQGLQNQWDVDVAAIRAVPSIQGEIIRCKDCKHRVVNENYGKSGHLINISAVCLLDTGDMYELGRNAWNDEWYCADAERREGGAE